MSPSVDKFVIAIAWGATGIGVGLVLWSWFGEKNPIQRGRFLDCGVVLLLSAVLLRIVAQEKVMSVFDWALALLAPLFIAGCLWRLTRTACPKGPDQ
ncbi:MAG: hypothetical protein EON90_08970 [Brevundimonas sp.]|nr:MAG: hypothetical protein EON90_08970 [Brevundimonas sp.]